MSAFELSVDSEDADSLVDVLHCLCTPVGVLLYEEKVTRLALSAVKLDYNKLIIYCIS